jgi:hypothetical protein
MSFFMIAPSFVLRNSTCTVERRDAARVSRTAGKPLMKNDEKWHAARLRTALQDRRKQSDVAA